MLVSTVVLTTCLFLGPQAPPSQPPASPTQIQTGGGSFGPPASQAIPSQDAPSQPTSPATGAITIGSGTSAAGTSGGGAFGATPQAGGPAAPRATISLPAKPQSPTDSTATTRPPVSSLQSGSTSRPPSGLRTLGAPPTSPVAPPANQTGETNVENRESNTPSQDNGNGFLNPETGSVPPAGPSGSRLPDVESVPPRTLPPSQAQPWNTSEATNRLNEFGNTPSDSSINRIPAETPGVGVPQGEPQVPPNSVTPTFGGVIGGTPATRQQPSEPAEEKVDVSLARQILDGVSHVRDRRRQPGDESVELEQLVRTASNVESRKQAVKSYWRLVNAELDHCFALLEAQTLEAQLAPADQAQAFALAAAKAKSRARLIESEQALRQAQFQVAERIGVSDHTRLVTVDAPFIGGYRTNFETYVATRPLASQIHQLHHGLPLQLNLIVARSEAVDSLEGQWEILVRAYQDGVINVASLLDGYQSLRDQRSAFLTSIRDYNNMICDYSLSVAPANLPADSVVPMLIKRQRDVVADQGNIRRTSFEASDADSLAPSTTTPNAASSPSPWRSLAR